MSLKKFDLIINQKISKFKKVIYVDSDKSISLRTFLLGSISKNISYAKNVLESADVISCIKCLNNLGVKITKKNNVYSIHGKGLGSLIARKNQLLNFGNSGTLARLLIGILSTTPNTIVRMSGDHSLRKRSMKNLITEMNKFGVSFHPKNKFYFPLKLISSKMPIGINYIAGVSAQIKSAVILAGLNSVGVTNIVEPYKSRNHTESMIAHNSKSIKIIKNKKKIIKVFGKKDLKSFNLTVPGDPSSAAFFSALTILSKNSKIKIKNVGLNSTRIGFYKLLQKHGAKIIFKNLRIKNNETVGDIVVSSSTLKPINSSKEYYVNSTDEYPILFVIAALTKGVSIFKGIKDLANKESNRITEMQKILKQVGIKTLASNNSLKIFGKGLIDPRDKKIYVPDLGDHRICMSTFVFSSITGATTKIKNFETVFTSSPSFLKIMKSLGANFEIQK
jgi:3-phosphoshikimate 1-carboxyvinyltransferase